MAQDQQIEIDLGELESRLERVRVLYEQYFMGIEKREPGVLRKDVERRIQQLRRVRFPSTAARFKFQTTIQRFNTLQQYWNRTCREIENGTYRRHVLRAKRRLATNPPEAPPGEAVDKAPRVSEARDETAADLAAMLEGDVDVEAEMASVLAALEKPKVSKTSISPRLSQSPKPKGLEPLKIRPTPGNPLAALGKKSPAPATSPPKTSAAPAARPTSPQPTAARPKAGPPPAPSMRPQAKPAARPQAKPAAQPAGASGLSSDRIKILHASYLEARMKTNASAVSFEKLEKNLRETEKRLREKHKGRQVDFDVSIKDGKAILKPRLK